MARRGETFPKRGCGAVWGGRRRRLPPDAWELTSPLAARSQRGGLGAKAPASIIPGGSSRSRTVPGRGDKSSFGLSKETFDPLGKGSFPGGKPGGNSCSLVCRAAHAGLLHSLQGRLFLGLGVWLSRYQPRPIPGGSLAPHWVAMPAPSSSCLLPPAPAFGFSQSDTGRKRGNCFPAPRTTPPSRPEARRAAEPLLLPSFRFDLLLAAPAVSPPCPAGGRGAVPGVRQVLRHISA